MSIPKVIHYIWVSETGNAQKPEKIERCLQSWRDQLKDYQIVEWNNDNLPINDFPFTREAFERKKWAFIADFFRLWILKEHGGIYLDSDVFVKSTFDPFLNDPLFVGTEFTDQISTHIIGAEKGHPFIEECFQYYDNRHFILQDGSNDMTPNSCIMTKIFIEKYKYENELVRFDGSVNRFSDMVIYPDSYFMIDIYDGHNVCVHEQFGTWRDDASKNPVMEDVIESYFWKKFCRHSVFRKPFLKKLAYLFLPMWVVVLISKRNSLVRNNKRAKNIRLNKG